MLRTHTCGQLTAQDDSASVTLCGWVHRRRDHGGLIFIDLRDHYGITQVVINPNQANIFKEAERVRPEWVLKVSGKVSKRIAGAERQDNPTGAIELLAEDLEVLTESKTPPFEIDQDASGVREDLRLQYRYLDLRRPAMQEMIVKRDKLITAIREYMHGKNFTEVQTPILANSSPEGARDYLVPSRLHPGMFYALPQAPQQFKQLLMVAGLDRYFQIAPCFRDEDPRADRHPGEFYQLDLEMSFVSQEDIFNTVEPLMAQLTKQFSDKEIITTPFLRMSWKHAIETYGSDKPDLRYALPLVDVTGLVKDSGFSVFADAAKTGVVKAMCVTGGSEFSRKDIDELTEVAKTYGAKGLAYILLRDGDIQSPILKFLGDDVTKQIVQAVDAKDGDAIFFSADKWLTACTALGQVRKSAAAKKGLVDSKKAAWVWIVDFPMYEWNEQDKKIDFSHNPFSMPQGGMDDLLNKDPKEILAYQYDLVCNGFELSSGAIRNHRPDIMYKAFEIAGYTKEDVDEKFGGMINAFQFGAPPHGGIAPGIDRLMMVLWECPSIRDIYAFPKNGKAQDVMMNAPSFVSDKQLKELHIKVVD